MQWRVPSSVGLPFCGYPGGSCVQVHPIFYGLVAPEKNEDGENEEWHPSAEDLASRVTRDGAIWYRRLRCACCLRGSGRGRASRHVVGIFGEAPDFFWLPEEQEYHRAKEREEAGGNVHQVAVHVVGPEKLHGGEGDSDDQDCGQNLKCFLPRDHSAHQPERDDYGGDGQNSPDHGVHVGFGKQRDGSKHVHRSADRPPGDGRGVGDEIQRCGMKGLESEAYHEGAGDCYGRTESRASFDKSAKAESNQQQLQAAIRRNAADGGFHDLEVTGADGDVVEIDGGDHDPNDIHQAGSHAVEKTLSSQGRGHVENENGDKDRGSGSSQSRPVRCDAEAGQ
jgi:hypothetical protein